MKKIFLTTILCLPFVLDAAEKTADTNDNSTASSAYLNRFFFIDTLPERYSCNHPSAEIIPPTFHEQLLSCLKKTEAMAAQSSSYPSQKTDCISLKQLEAALTYFEKAELKPLLTEMSKKQARIKEVTSWLTLRNAPGSTTTSTTPSGPTMEVTGFESVPTKDIDPTLLSPIREIMSSQEETLACLKKLGFVPASSEVFSDPIQTPLLFSIEQLNIDQVNIKRGLEEVHKTQLPNNKIYGTDLHIYGHYFAELKELIRRPDHKKLRDTLIIYLSVKEQKHYLEETLKLVEALAKEDTKLMEAQAQLVANAHIHDSATGDGLFGGENII